MWPSTIRSKFGLGFYFFPLLSFDFILHELFWVKRHHFFFPLNGFIYLVQPSLQHLEGLRLIFQHVEGCAESAP